MTSPNIARKRDTSRNKIQHSKIYISIVSQKWEFNPLTLTPESEQTIFKTLIT